MNGKSCWLLLSAVVAQATFAGELYVSHLKDGNGDPVYDGAPAGATVYDDLQTAIDAAAANDTVWVEDGFVCSSGVSDVTVNKTTVQTRLVVGNKALTITSRSGDWRTGAEIRGKFADAYDPTKPNKNDADKTKTGAGAVSCIVCANKTALFRGFRVMDGATVNVEKYGGGALNGQFTNCLFSGCASYLGGGGLYSSTASDCVISNCCAATTVAGKTPRGGGAADATLYKCLVVDCYSSGQGGGMNSGTAYDSTFVRCHAGYGGASRGTNYRCLMYDCSAVQSGGAGYQGYFYDCVVSNCTASSGAGGAASMYRTEGTLFVENGGSGVINVGNDSEIISNCTIIASTGYAVCAPKIVMTTGEIVDCTIVSRTGVGVQAGNDNGNAAINLRRCTVTVSEGQCAVKCVMSTKYLQKTRNCYAWDCTFNGPLYGAGAYYNCLVTGSRSTGPIVDNDVQITVDSEKVNQPLYLYNCTVTGNTVLNAAKGVDGFEVHACNTIVRGNVRETPEALTTAVNCCLEDDAVAISETGCVRTDPLLMTGDDGFLYPSEGSPCRAAGSLTAYALTETDLAGRPRTTTSSGGETVAIGACEFDPDLAGAEIGQVVVDPLAPATGTFSASCSGLGTEGLVYYWDLNGDGTTDETTTVPVCRYYYGEAGTYSATLCVSNGVRGVSTVLEVEIPEGYYVSKNDIHAVDGREGGWGTFIHADGSRHVAYTNLQQAVDAAPPYGTVYLDDGYVCEDGMTTVGNANPVNYRVYVTKVLTLSSRTGELTANGPVIRGAYQTPGALTVANAQEKCGADAVACVRCNQMSGGKPLTTLVGIHLVGGATCTGTESYESGGGAHSLILRNCRIADCVAWGWGGGAHECQTENCRFENCIASGTGTNHGGGVRNGTHSNDVFVACYSGTHGGGASYATCQDCTFTNCTASSYGGASRYGSLYGCTLVDCSAPSGAGGSGDANLYGSRIIRCSAPAVYKGSVYDCLFLDNTAASGKGVAYSCGAAEVISNCVFVGNGTKDDPVAGIYSSTRLTFIDCVFSNNVGSAVDVYYGGSAAELVNCRVNCTNDSCCALRTRKHSTKTLLNCLVARNCVIEGPVNGSGEYYNCRISGARSKSSAAVSCTEVEATYSGETKPLVLVNCTVTDNASVNATGGADGGYVVAVNSIVWGNTGKAGKTDSFLAATNSCLAADAVTGTSVGCVSANPRFIGTDEEPFVPKSPKCRGGVVFDWMSDPDDVRSSDLAGKPRLRNGAVDRGAYQMEKPLGLIFLVR